MQTGTVTLHTTDGRTYTNLPLNTVDDADKGYINDAKLALAQLEQGLITEYECMVSLIQAHARWASI